MSRYKNLGAYKFTLYDDDDISEIETGSVGTLTSIEQYNLKSQGEVFLNLQTKINFGVQISHSIVKPFESKFTEEIDDDESTYTSFTPLPYDELSAYGEGDIRVGN